jgi:hypothetical protein
MAGGELLTKVTIWAAVAGYAAGAAAFALSGGRVGWERAARLAWTFACSALFAHVACAFHFYHGWGHESAYLDTARQTYEVFGLDWGGGLYINYALMAGWVIDVAWWWLRGPDSYRRRPRTLTFVWHGFLLFIFFNATVVFKSGAARWAGLGVCLGVSAVWWLGGRGLQNRRTGSPVPAEE